MVLFLVRVVVVVVMVGGRPFAVGRKEPLEVAAGEAAGAVDDVLVLNSRSFASTREVAAHPPHALFV